MCRSLLYTTFLLLYLAVPSETFAQDDTSSLCPPAKQLTETGGLKSSADPNTVAAMEEAGFRFVAEGTKSDWSPDGQRLVIARMPYGAGLSIHDLKSGEASELTDHGKDPAWAPGDGRFIAFVRGGNDVRLRPEKHPEEIWLIQSTGGEATLVAEGSFPCWGRDGTTLYFRSNRDRCIKRLNVRVKDAEPEKVLGMPYSIYPAVSPDAKYALHKKGDAIVVVALKTGKTVHSWPMPESRGCLGGWSLDSRMVGFGGYAEGFDDYGLWVLDLDTEKLRHLDIPEITMPAWSRDGTQISVDLRSKTVHEIWVAKTQAIETLPHNSSFAMRRDLVGRWRVTSIRRDGKDVEVTTPTQLIITADKFTMVEGDRQRAWDYTVDAEAKPARLSTLFVNGPTRTSLHYAFKLMDAKLLLCLTPRPNSEAPDTVETNEGDGRMLMEFQREAPAARERGERERGQVPCARSIRRTYRQHRPVLFRPHFLTRRLLRRSC